MERLTKYEVVGGHVHAVPTGDVDQAMMRLAAYEDTKLTPGEVHSLWGEWNAMMRVLNSIGSYDRLRELAEDDKDRRLVVLPCRVGRIVYVPDFEAQTVANIRVQGISITPTGRVVLHFGGYPAASAWGDRCGVDWFLTYEGAEAALKEAQNG